jgi:glutathione reductase (NADPH)
MFLRRISHSGFAALSCGTAYGVTRRPVTCAASSEKHFDLIVIGGGSGGLAAAKRSAEYGAKVCIIEQNEWGGTCVDVGCVPRKVMFNAAHVQEIINDAGHFGFSVPYSTFDWGNLKRSRETYIKRLNGIYERGLNKLDITQIHNQGYASFDKDGKTINVGSKKYSADHVVIAVGGAPNSLNVPGDEHALNSDDFFHKLHEQPKKVAVIGAGYIAVELAGVLNGLGSDTSLFVRGDNALRSFDDMLQQNLDKSMKHAGVKIVPQSTTKEIVEESDGTFSLHLENGDVHRGFNAIIKATGRTPITNKLGLESIGVKTLKSGHITVDDYQNTSVPNVYALGDACDKFVDLTPMAIAAGRRLGDRLFGGPQYKESKADYKDVATVVFSHPPIGTIGLTEKQAIEKYGAENCKVYNSGWVNLWYGPYYNGGVGDKPISRAKVIVTGEEEKIVGLHMIGEGSDEVVQGFAVAIKMGATKADLDNAVAIHPTAAEELVTLPPWGKSGQKK